MSIGPNHGFSCSHLIAVYLLELCNYDKKQFHSYYAADSIRPSDLFYCSTPLLLNEEIIIKEDPGTSYIFSAKIIIIVFVILFIIMLALLAISLTSHGANKPNTFIR